MKNFCFEQKAFLSRKDLEGSSLSKLNSWIYLFLLILTPLAIAAELADFLRFHSPEGWAYFIRHVFTTLVLIWGAFTALIVLTALIQLARLKSGYLEHDPCMTSHPKDAENDQTVLTILEREYGAQTPEEKEAKMKRLREEARNESRRLYAFRMRVCLCGTALFCALYVVWGARVYP